MWIFLVAPKQRPTFPSNRNNLGRGALSAASLQHPRSPAVSLERVYVLTRRSVPPPCPVIAVKTGCTPDGFRGIRDRRSFLQR